MQPTDFEILQTIVLIHQRLNNPVMQQDRNAVYRQGYEEVIHILQNRITDPEQIRHLTNPQVSFLAEQGIRYLLGDYSRDALLFTPIEGTPEFGRHKTIIRGKILYEAIQHTCEHPDATDEMKAFANQLQVSLQRNGLAATFIKLAEADKKLKPAHVDYPGSYSINDN